MRSRSADAALAIVYRASRDAAEKTVAAAKAAGVNAIAVKADARNADQIEAAVNETVKSLGRLDILINMASTYIKTPNPTEADWTDAIDSNAKSAFMFATHAARSNEKRRRGAHRQFHRLAADQRAASLQRVCALLHFEGGGRGADREPGAGTGAGDPCQCDRARADPRASRHHRGGNRARGRGDAAAAMGRRRGNRAEPRCFSSRRSS